jgi:DNA polymerase I-like protein with 3'-5' exonuclease and polymerase domains
MRYVGFDLETDGLLPDLSKVHMAILVDLETRETLGYTDEPWKVQGASQEPSGTIQDALDILSEADLLVTFNGWDFDMLALEKLYPEWDYQGYHLDLMVHGATIRPYDMLKRFDASLIKKGRMPKWMLGRESLEAWAIRAGGELKDDYKGPWETLTPEMWDYGLQDGRTTASVYHWMMQSKFRVPWMTMWIEQEVGRIVGRQRANGWRIDVPYLQWLDGQLAQDCQKAKGTMAAAFGDWYRVDKQKVSGRLFRNPKGRWKAFQTKEIPSDLLESDRYQSWPVKIPRKTMRRKGIQYTEGACYTPIELHKFNPNARQDVYRGLNRRYGWEPNQRTDTGAPKVSEETLSGLEWPEAQAAHRYFLLSKISGYTAAWLKQERNGRLYGHVNTNRANTRRMTHQSPNLAQVPAKGALYGEECRRVFTGDDGWVLVGADAEQLELRCLAKRLAPYDGGSYAEELLSGDAHTLHISAAAGIPRESVTSEIRKGGKTVTYAFLYGAGNNKLAQSYRPIQGVPKRTGKAIREGYEKGIKGLGPVIESLQSQIAERGYIRALDGGKLFSRSEHSALNLQLQSDGALVMKVALIFADQILAEAGYSEGRDFKFVGNVHDEAITTCRPELADVVGRALVGGMRRAGEWFNYPLPIEGQYLIGSNWSETH